MQQTPTSRQAAALAPLPAAAAPIPLMLKGLVACLLLIVYAGLMATYILAERQLMFGRLNAMDDLHSIEEAFKRAGLAVSSALLPLRQLPLGADPTVAARDATPYALEAVEQSLREWRGRFPGLTARHALAQRRLATLTAQPSLANLVELRESLEGLAREIDGESTRVREERRAMGREYRDRNDRLALTALVLGLGGLVVFGGITAWFFARLASELRILGQRAQEVVAGYRGEPLEVTRRDEVGALTRAVNRMSADLAERERELAVARELRAHREKMAALGAVARNLSHEIGNPLATISAIVQNLSDAQVAGPCRACQPEVILAQTRRIGEITRQIADFAGPRADSPEAIDAGGMLRAVCEFMRYDPRFRATRIEARVANDLPVLVVVPDELSEVLMNLLQMCVDTAAGEVPGRIEVEAMADGKNVRIQIHGGAAPGDGARRSRTRQLVEGMGGRMMDRTTGAAGYEILLPAHDAVRTGN